MQKKFVINLAILIILNLLIKPFWILGIEPNVQSEVGNEAYGEYFALFNFSFLLNILLDFGITNFNNKNIAQNNHLLAKHFSSLFTLKLALSIIYFIITLSIGLIIGFDMRYMKLLIVLCFNQFLISMILYLRSNLLGLHLFKTDSIVSVLDRLIMVAFCIAIIWFHVFGIKMDILWFVYSQTAAYLLTALILFVIVFKHSTHFKFTWNYAFNVMILKKSFPFAVLVLLMTFYNRLDAVMIERLLPNTDKLLADPDFQKVFAAMSNQEQLDFINSDGAKQAGIYAKAFRLLDAANMIAYLFSVQLLPIFSRMLSYKESVESLVKLAFTLLITPAIIVSIGCSFYAADLTALINKGSTDSAPVFAVLMSCFMAVSTTYIFGTLLTANGNLKQLNLMALTGICINIILNVILIRYNGALGSAYSGLITQSLTALIQLYLASKIFKFRVNHRLIVLLVLFVIGVLLANYFTHKLPFDWRINFVIMAGVSGLWALAIGLINIKSILRFVKY